jgi:hypothetical protein
MESHEIQEQAEHAHHAGEKGIGLTTAIVAVLLAVATLLSHRSHTEEIKLQTQTNDQWGFYQAKHGRAYLFAALAEFATRLPNSNDIAMRDLKKSIEEDCGVPVEKGCTTPIKDSPILKELLATMKSEAATPENSGTEGAAQPPAHSAEKAEKHEKPATGEHGATKTEKPAKEGTQVKEGANKIQERARELEQETQLIEHRANWFDTAELFLEISIVLCSVALLAGNKLFWKLSFISTAVGIGVMAWGLLLK